MTACARKRLTAIFLTMALAVLGVHSAMQAPKSAASDADLAAFLSIGGSVADICDQGDRSHGDCPLCRECDVADIPTSGVAAHTQFAVGQDVAVALPDPDARPGFARTFSRGPPNV